MVNRSLQALSARIYISFTVGGFTTEKRKNKVTGLRLKPEVADEFRAIAASERRDLSVQFEIILSEWKGFKSGKVELIDGLSRQAHSVTGKRAAELMRQLGPIMEQLKEAAKR